MDLEYSDKVQELLARVETFMDEHIFAHELDYWEWVDDAENLWQYPP